jgi:hypothetical protein
VRLLKRHIETHEKPHYIYSFIGCDAEDDPNVDIWRNARSAHLPRQAEIYSRQIVILHRSTLADWVGRADVELRPVVDALMTNQKRSTKLLMDETRAPVLGPGKRKTRTG